MSESGDGGKGREDGGVEKDGKVERDKVEGDKVEEDRVEEDRTGEVGAASGARVPDGAEGAASPVFALVDYTDPDDARDLVALLDGYARDPTGGGEPLPDVAREHLAATLALTPNAFSLIGRLGSEPVALANCFVTLSTFACRPLVNVHDLAVAPDHRGRGVGRALLAAVEAEARARGACKITLEVLEGNAVARRAYERTGFRAYALDEAYGTALFLQKTL